MKDKTRAVTSFNAGSPKLLDDMKHSAKLQGLSMSGFIRQLYAVFQEFEESKKDS